jgi:2'-5' RNA ligase
VAVELLDPEGAIAARARAVRAAVDAVLGRPADPAPHWPHVTVARLRPAARVDVGGIRVPEHVFDISRAALYDSHQSPAGPPRYRELAAIDLGPVP